MFALTGRIKVSADELDSRFAAAPPSERIEAFGVGELADLEAVVVLLLLAELGVPHRDEVRAGFRELHFDAGIDADSGSVVVPGEPAAGRVEHLNQRIDGRADAARFHFNDEPLALRGLDAVVVAVGGRREYR